MADSVPSSPDETPAKPPDGLTLLCEGAMRCDFGRQPSQALANALAELAQSEADLASTDTTGIASELSLIDLVSSWLQRYWRWAGVALGVMVAIVALWGVLALPNRQFPVLTVCDHVTATRAGRPVKIAPGDRLRAGTTLIADARGSAVLDYRSEPTTLALRTNTTLTVLEPSNGKKFNLTQGRVEISAAHQPAGKPMRVIAPQGEIEVVGTRFALDARIASTWLEVQQGTVRLASVGDPTTPPVSVQAGEYAVAADGIDLVPRALDFDPNSRPMLPLRLEFGKGAASGDGAWIKAGTAIRQQHVSLYPWGSQPEFPPGGRLFPISEYMVPFKSGSSLQIQSTIAIDRTLPEAAPGRALSGRIGLRLFAGSHALDFLLSCETRGVYQVFAWTEMNQESNWKSSIIGGGPGPQFGRHAYQFKLRIDRRADGSALLQGKIWIGGNEPDYWPIRAEVPHFGSVSSFGFDCMHCAATFSDCKAWLIE